MEVLHNNSDEMAGLSKMACTVDIVLSCVAASSGLIIAVPSVSKSYYPSLNFQTLKEA